MSTDSERTTAQRLESMWADWWYTGRTLVLGAGLLGGVMLERHVLHEDIPGFEHRAGLIFENCYAKRTRVEIASCLDSAYASAREAGAWD